MKLTLVVCLLAFVTIGYAQNCPQVVSATIQPVSPNNYSLNMVYTADGTKHFKISFYCGVPVPANLVSTQCIAVRGNGSMSVNFTCAGTNPNAVIVPYTGNCSVGTNCDSVQVGNGGPLPLKMIGFYIKRNNAKVSLNWQTENEVNINDFVIEKLENNLFRPVATVPATNNPNGDSYSFIEENTSKGTSQYRLKVIEQDGRYSFSEIKAVKGMGASTEFIVFPNPAIRDAKVTISDISDPMDLQVIDQAGKVIKMMEVTGSNTIEINNLPKGLYIIRLLNKITGESTSRKLSVLH